MLTVLSVFGTRPEAIKMAPVLRELARHPSQIRSIVCVTAQHRQMLDQVLGLFGIVPDYDLNLMQTRQSLTLLAAHILTNLEPVLEQVRPDWLLVQGDTTTTLAGGLAAFYHGVRVGHIEAGLRTHNRMAPFPEEVNRRLTTCLADLHFAPTTTAREALLAEGVPPDRVLVTGNTVVDALSWARSLVQQEPPTLPDAVATAMAGRRLVLVTGHRRESFGENLRQICLALRTLAERNPDICIIYPVHLNPNVREAVFPILRGLDRVVLLDPLPYAAFVWLMDRSYLILTDSGGVQEEAPTLGKPVLVLRTATERSEGLQAGNARLVGLECGQIVAEAEAVLSGGARYQQMATAGNPYGDGHAASRVVEALLRAGPERC